MKVCVVGCGAVGSLFAANLAQLDDVEVWAYDVSRPHVDAINTNGLRLTGAGNVIGRPRATTDATELPGCDFGIVATKAMHTEGAIAATAHAFSDGAVATVQENGVGNEEVVAAHVAAGHRGTTFPAGKILEPGLVQWDVKGDTTSGRSSPSPRAQRRSPASRRVHARRDAGLGGGRRATRAVAEGHLQRGDEPGRRAHGAHARRVCERPDLRAIVSRSWTRGRPSPPRRGSCSTPIPRS